MLATWSWQVFGRSIDVDFLAESFKIAFDALFPLMAGVEIGNAGIILSQRAFWQTLAQLVFRSATKWVML